MSDANKDRDTLKGVTLLVSAILTSVAIDKLGIDQRWNHLFLKHGDPETHYLNMTRGEKVEHPEGFECTGPECSEPAPEPAYQSSGEHEAMSDDEAMDDVE
jgi:hypothetical protein